MRLVNKHWRHSIDQSVSELTIDKWRLRRAGIESGQALYVAQNLFPHASILRCCCPKDEDWLNQICNGPFQKIKALYLSGDLAKQSIERLRNCRHLRRLQICSPNLGQHEFHHLSTLTALQTLDMKGSSINEQALASFGQLSSLKVNPKTMPSLSKVVLEGFELGPNDGR